MNQETWGASMGMSQNQSLLIYGSKKNEIWVKTRRQNNIKKHYTILPCQGIHQQAFNIPQKHPRGNPNIITQVYSSKLIWPMH